MLQILIVESAEPEIRKLLSDVIFTTDTAEPWPLYTNIGFPDEKLHSRIVESIDPETINSVLFVTFTHVTWFVCPFSIFSCFLLPCVLTRPKFLEPSILF